MATKISIQGYEGCFHQVAARKYFGNNVEVIPCATFRDVVKIASDTKESDGGVMAIENSIAGSILSNYNLLKNTNLQIVGEVYLHIQQNLLVNPGVRWEDIQEVHSHPMAILQCLEFLEKNNWKVVETEDTALSAKYIHLKGSKHIAAIASKLAADLFELDIIAPNIHTTQNNNTRFLILQRPDRAIVVKHPNKASIIFDTDPSKGRLAKVLTKIADSGINLDRIQSMPIPGTYWKHFFYVDMEFENKTQFDEVIDSIKPLTENLKILGIYKKGNI